MKILNISSLNRDNTSTLANPLSLFTSAGLGLNVSIVTTSGSIDDLSTLESSSIKLKNATTVTGLANGENGKLVILHNGNSSSITISNSSSSSSLENRIFTGSGADLTLLTNSSLLLQYDTDSTIWRVIGGSGTGGGSESGGGSSITFTSSTDFPLGSPIYFNGVSWELAKSDSISTVTQYVISKKVGSGSIEYTALANGELTLTTSGWDAIKESGTGGLTAGETYYLSPSTSGKIVSWIPVLKSPVIRAISSTKAFINLSINYNETGMGDSFMRETFTGNNVNSTFTLTKAPASIDYTWVYINGVFQIPNDAYTLSGATINFTGIPSNGAIISVQYARAILLADTNSINRFTCFTETVSGSAKNIFNLPSIPANVTSAIVFVGGTIQDTSKYSITENILTFFDSIDVGVQVIAYILNSSGVVTSYDSFVSRKEINITSTEIVTISNIFLSQVSGVYRLFDIVDPRISANIYLKNNGVGVEPDVRIDSNSSSISINKDTSNKLNIYIESNEVNIQNLLNRTSQLKIYREI